MLIDWCNVHLQAAKSATVRTERLDLLWQRRSDAFWGKLPARFPIGGVFEPSEAEDEDNNFQPLY